MVARRVGMNCRVSVKSPGGGIEMVDENSITTELPKMLIYGNFTAPWYCGLNSLRDRSLRAPSDAIGGFHAQA
jgi:hypothetical protein